MKKIIFNETKKFNTINISFRFLSNMNREDVTSRALIPYVLRSATKNYPNDFLLNKKMDEFYGASLTSGVMRSGNLSAVMFNVRFVNPSIIKDKNYSISTVFDFLKEIIYNPILENGVFKKSIVEREKETLEDEILSEIENKASFAMSNLYELMFKGTNGAIRANGYIEDLESIDSKKLYDEYQKMLSNDDIIIVVSGNITDTDKAIFKNDDRENKKFLPYVYERSSSEYEIKEVITEGAQSNLTIGYDTQIFRNDPRYVGMMVLNNIFGSGANSLLFQSVREEHSLCYSIYSTYNNIYGMVTVGMGIKHSDKDKCLSLVDEQVTKLVNKNFDENLLEEAKKNLKNSFNSVQDNQTTLLTYAYNEEIFDIKYDMDEIFNEIDKVTMDDISNLAKLFDKKAAFFLTGGDEVEE